ncbi:sulfurtransferase TusA family protein [Roseomonas frigidaquae]|uniref:Sulfurtransferase TusA family protein n=1 Tax=Falsiroseomonas frigidaquae TaxID=487318 RepID=A0ABX1EY22_9PROT|nr:sulfurtransferase TusA family protein [Falsiroseomonas frigidaquae]NKE44953.1 sulfurtransferase TusA family protein [Falsiroseomonas frigidaquae]
MSETLLDVQGLTCPLPVLKANKALRSLPAGARLVVLATDPASVKDFRAYAAETGHALVGFSEDKGQFRFTLRKREDPPAQAEPEA